MDTSQLARCLEKTAGARRLEDVSLASVRGNDARSWLNGQISNDLAASRSGHALYAVAPSAKGKILADMWVLDHGDMFWMSVPKETHHSLLEHLSKYIIMEDVDIAPAEDHELWSLQGPRAHEVAKAVGIDGVERYACERLGPCGVDLIVPSSQSQDVQSLLTRALASVEGALVSQAAWELVRLRNGVPQFGIDFDHRHFPQEAGIKGRAVSFKKGCYVGQEAIAMLEHRGKLKQRLVGISASSSTTLAVGQPLLDSAHNESGAVTSAVYDRDQDGWVGLAYVAYPALEAGDIIQTTKGEPITIRSAH
ncbi:MAG: folate-binding protein YgfZ [Myxococcales bacterium]|nr:folate-binding protein YgfZ [Myxococcales bacterium]MCB9708037.1 folate-binding protein YgfZ [Myxococcales bacterium]